MEHGREEHAARIRKHYGMLLLNVAILNRL
jgi:hypothetical protein